MNLLEKIQDLQLSNQRLFEAMDDGGADLDAIHTVEHHFVATQKSILEGIREEAVFLGYGFTEIEETQNDDGSAIFVADVLSHIPILSEDYGVFIPAGRETIIMLALAEACGGEYDGWGAKMIKK